MFIEYLKFNGSIFSAKYRSDLIFYHMSYEYKTLDLLNKTNSLSSVILENPPLWISRRDRDIFINNAKIIPEKSNYITRSRTGDSGKEQVNLGIIYDYIWMAIYNFRY